MTVRLFIITSYVKIIAFQTIIIHCLWVFYITRKDCSLYNKQNNTVLGNTRFISRVKHDISLVCCAHSWDITFNTRNKSGISKHPCIILYIIRRVRALLLNSNNSTFGQYLHSPRHSQLLLNVIIIRKVQIFIIYAQLSIWLSLSRQDIITSAS